jgi:cell division protein FtsI (penicillin-binding protein 3)
MGKEYKSRIRIVYIFFISLFVILSLKIAYLQIFRSDFLRKLAKGQYYRLIPLEGRRGRILDCKGRVLVKGVNSYSVFANPGLVKEISKTAQVLAKNLGLSKKKVDAKLRKKNRFVWIKRKVSWEEKEKIEELKLKGVGFIKEERRFYPQQDLASTVLGIVSVDNKGLNGLELRYDNYLRGKEGLVRVLQDSGSRDIILSPQIVNPEPGVDISITLDSQIQYWVHNYLKETIEEFKGKRGSVAVMDASNGKLLALANYPGFDPYEIGKLSPGDMKNRAVTDMFEPGSVFKIVTLLASVDKGQFSNDDKIFCENGKFKIPGSYLHDWRPYGELTFKEVFKKSSNIGVAKIANILGPDVLYQYMKKLKFGEKTGVDFPGEVKGLVKPVSEWSKTSMFIMPIGQEIGVNLLQLTRAFAVIANGGYLVKPHLVKDISAPFFSKKVSPDKIRIFSQETIERVRNILIEVVEEGTAKLARVEGVKVGGKTGTAQKYDPKIKKYSPTKYRATFVGFLSDFSPPIVIGVTIDEPRKSHFGGVVAAPLFKKIAEKIVTYMREAED